MASSAARIVRPEKSTSSTRITSLPADATGRLDGLGEGPDPAQPQVVAIEGGVDGADGRRQAAECGDPVGQAGGQGDAAGRYPEQHDIGAEFGRDFDYLMGDAIDGASHISGVEHSGRAHSGSADQNCLLARLTGRSLKDEKP